MSSKQAGYSAFLLTHWRTSSGQKASAPQASGLMTKPSFASPESTWKSTTDQGPLSKESSERPEAGSNRAEDCGRDEAPCWMDGWKNSTKIWHSPSETWQPTGATATPMTCLTLIEFPPSWGSHGNDPRISTSVHPSPSSDSLGTLEKRWSPYDPKRRTNIYLQSRNGERQGPTPWRKHKSYTENCYTPPWLTQTEDHTSPAWRPCLESSMTILTFRAPHPGKSLMTSTGGPSNSPNRPSEEVSQQHMRFVTSLLSQTQAQAQASQSSLE